MIIDILTEVILNQIREDTVINQDTSDLVKSVKNLSFQSVIEKYTLDFKQSVAFEIMASSFLLKSLNVGNVPEDVLESFFEGNDGQRKLYVKSLSGLRKYLIDQGGHNDLVMFLSGMGGTGKSEVIKAFVHFAKNISHAFGWKYDNDVIKITALTGAAACEIPNGRTLHSQACLSSQNISQKQKDTWVYTKMLIIDEVSFLDEDNLRKLDKHLRKLKEKDVIFGGVHVVFVGDFFQMVPVRGLPLFKNNTIQFNAINRAVFLNVSHRFSDDHLYGEIMRRFRIGLVTKEDIQMINRRYCENSDMRRFRIGLVTKEDIQMINRRYCENSDVMLPQVPKIRCARYMNDERNAYNNVIFMEHLKATHPKADALDTRSPMHTCIIKANMRYGSKSIGKLYKSMYNHILDQCGDSDITNGSGAFVDPALKFFHNMPLMMNTNVRNEEELANGTPCRGLYIK